MNVLNVSPSPGHTFLDPAFKANRDAPVHRWIPWVAGYSKYFVADALKRYLATPGVVLDPFAGVGTTLVEADLAGHEVIGFEINPYAAFVSQVKLRAHAVDPSSLHNTIDHFLASMAQDVRRGTQPQSVPPAGFRTRSPFYSPAVEQKVLLVLDFIEDLESGIADLYRMAFAATMVSYSNYSYEPSLGRKATVGRADVDDYNVAEAMAEKLRQMADDIAWYRETRDARKRQEGRILKRSFFDDYSKIKEGSVDLVITSPPYLNNYHYNRNTRPHMYWLGFCSSPNEMKRLEELNFGTYWQNARTQDCIDLDPTIEDKLIQQTLADIRQQNPNKGVYGGSGWANYATRYFNDCARFLDGVAWSLAPGAATLVVIGNSILQGVPVPTDQFLANIAADRGFTVAGIHIPRDTRVGNSILNSSVRAGKTKGTALYESIVELKKL